MINIYLTRHGQDEDNVLGILNGRRNKPLTEIGRQQAERLARKINDLKISFEEIYSSPLIRAYETARIISRETRCDKPRILTALIERDFGVMTGKNNNQIEELCAPEIIKTKNATYFLTAKGAETFPELINRAKRVLEFVQQKYQQGNILLVSHGDFGKMIFCAYYKLDWQKVLKMFHFGNSELILLSAETKPNQAKIFATKQYNQ